MERLHLWEIQQPYRCTSYYHIETVSSWQEFLDSYKNMDGELNLLFRWDWRMVDEDGYEIFDETPENLAKAKDAIDLHYLLQRKGYVCTTRVLVNKNDEQSIRQYLVKTVTDNLFKFWENV